MSSPSLYDISTSETSQDAETESLVTTLKGLLSKIGSRGPDDRKQLKETASKLSLALETPGDTVQRVAYLVRFPYHSLLAPRCTLISISPCRQL